jgi:hypothetical protein
VVNVDEEKASVVTWVAAKNGSVDQISVVKCTYILFCLHGVGFYGFWVSYSLLTAINPRKGKTSDTPYPDLVAQEKRSQWDASRYQVTLIRCRETMPVIYNFTTINGNGNQPE